MMCRKKKKGHIDCCLCGSRSDNLRFGRGGKESEAAREERPAYAEGQREIDHVLLLKSRRDVLAR